MQKKMKNEMETGVIKGPHRDPSIQNMPTLGPKVCSSCLDWAIRLPVKVYNALINMTGAFIDVAQSIGAVVSHAAAIVSFSYAVSELLHTRETN